MNLDWLAKFLPPAPPPTNPNGANWYYKFARFVAAPTAPQTTAVSIPTTAQKGHMQVRDAILAYNNGIANFAGGLTEWQNAEEGVAIHKITLDQANAISTRIKPSCEAYELPLTYTLACLAIESDLDPNCQNANIGVTASGVKRSNPNNDPLLYDMGIAQLKLTYLVNVAHGVTDHDSALAFALDVNRAIPYHCSLMASKVLWAQNVIQQNTSSVPDPRLNNPYMLATAAYNFGNTGVMTYYETGQFPSHCQHVLDLETYFAKQLGVKSIFADLTPTP